MFMSVDPINPFLSQSTLNSASSVKKWIPSIKNEIEYYLQQSQLSHYPERKIAEFQSHIEALEKEYKRFMAKLRVLDPSCKYKPWTPRAYCKRRADTQESPSNVKIPRPCEPHDGLNQWSERESGMCSISKSSATEGPRTFLETGFQTLVPSGLASETSELVHSPQDQPLSFDHKRLAVAAAAFRGPSVQLSSSQTQNLARMLQSSLPNLNNSLSRQRYSLQSRVRENTEQVAKTPVTGHKCSIQENKSGCEAAERIPKKPFNTETTEERTTHVLGLDCYSSSDEDCHS
ncbi:uncharacterized protein [Leuresthes tenuis]|uniref:uncharacterized protein isoform X2 n=1 Tax=Leuresthes tenuis TaxID=355514 RepID=UPI003B507EF2